MAQVAPTSLLLTPSFLHSLTHSLTDSNVLPHALYCSDERVAATFIVNSCFSHSKIMHLPLGVHQHTAEALFSSSASSSPSSSSTAAAAESLPLTAQQVSLNFLWGGKKPQEGTRVNKEGEKTGKTYCLFVDPQWHFPVWDTSIWSSVLVRHFRDDMCRCILRVCVRARSYPLLLLLPPLSRMRYRSIILALSDPRTPVCPTLTNDHAAGTRAPSAWNNVTKL